MKFHSLLKSRFTKWEDLEKEIEKLPTTKQRGDVFEEFIFCYLELKKSLYQIESHYMAKDIQIEFIHCLLYALPFLLITGLTQVFLIFITHYIIDRYNLVTWFLSKRNGVDMSNFGFSKDRPTFIAVWLNIITDNAFHIMGNYAIITWC